MKLVRYFGYIYSPNTCRVPTLTEEMWLEVSQRFHTLWNLTNCVGSLDGKHIRIRAAPNSGSSYINYKSFFSIILLAVVDADGLFLTTDVGEYGRNGDARALQESNFGRALQQGELNLPAPSPLPGQTQNVPYYFVGDEAFPLKENSMKPYGREQFQFPEQV
ncbi:unnamed protein product [Colias eurytheme]|nr:unnamed protein product [Colias eurytheme]